MLQEINSFSVFLRHSECIFFKKSYHCTDLYRLSTNFCIENRYRMVIFASNKKNIIKSIIMSTFQKVGEKMTNFRWIICGLLFFATTVNYLDRQVLSLTWKDFIAPEFHWTDSNYGDITASFLYSVCHCQPVRRSFH